jgi:hypothetical protein
MHLKSLSAPFLKIIGRQSLIHIQIYTHVVVYKKLYERKILQSFKGNQKFKCCFFHVTLESFR